MSYVTFFQFEEFVHTDTNMDNSVSSPTHLANIAGLWNYLDSVREKLGKPIIINSAFRTPEVNEQIRGSKRSLHMQGRAADIRTFPLYMDELYAILKEDRYMLSELIKYPTFIHVAL